MNHLLATPTAHDMREFYHQAGILATSEAADVALIRSHIAYWSGAQKADRASIKPSRGHTYRVAPYGRHDKGDKIVRVVDPFDHRDGVIGWGKP